jgi:divalent metal cation (Fe/Co/Zn/Cd) transporter
MNGLTVIGMIFAGFSIFYFTIVQWINPYPHEMMYGGGAAFALLIGLVLIAIGMWIDDKATGDD